MRTWTEPLRGARGRCGLGLAVVLGLGCGDDLPSPGLGSGSGAGIGTTVVVASTGPGPAAPEVIDIGQDALVLREGESIVLTAVVFDADDDVVAGELHGPGEPGWYGDFVPHGSDRWRVEVSWAAVNEQQPLQFQLELALPFVATFVDAAGHQAEGRIELRAVCAGITDTACEGTCIDPQGSDEHCGSCGAACPRLELRGGATTGGCAGASCRPRWSDCLDPRPPLDCASQCATRGQRCIEQGCDGGTVMRYDDAALCERGAAGTPTAGACGADLVSMPAAAAVRCCCG